MHSSGDRSRNETGAEMDGQPGNEGIAETGEVGGCPSSQRGDGFTIPAETRVATWKRWVFQALALIAMPFLLVTRFAAMNPVFAIGLCVSLTGICYFSWLVLQTRRLLVRHHGKRFHLPQVIRHACRTQALRLWWVTHWPTAFWLSLLGIRTSDYYPAFLILVAFWILVDLFFGLMLAREITLASSFIRISLQVIALIILIGLFIYICSLMCHVDVKLYISTQQMNRETKALLWELNSPTDDRGPIMGASVPLYESCGIEVLTAGKRRTKGMLCYAYLFGCGLVGLPIGILLIRKP